MSARPARTLAVALLAALLGVLLPATAAQAAGRTVQGGRLDWGIKSSFQSYVTGPIAKGSFKLKNGAATAGGSLFRFHSAAGSYDPDSGEFNASFTGGVSFQGHQKPDGAYELDMTVEAGRPSRSPVAAAPSTWTSPARPTTPARSPASPRCPLPP